MPILNNHHLDEIENPWLQRLKTKIIGYTFTTEWIKGTLNNTPDTLSRNPVLDPQPGKLFAEGSASSAEVCALISGQHDSRRLTDLHRTASQDEEYQQLKHYIEAGFPQKRSQLPEKCQRYWNVRSQLTIDDGLIMFGYRLLISVKLQRSVFCQLHAAHQGSVRTKLRARQVVYWPSIDYDIDKIILTCKQCQGFPLQEIAIDFWSYGGQQFLVIVDCYTDWPEIIYMGKDTTTSCFTIALLTIFSRYGAPDIWSDQGPQFMSQTFQKFSREWGFQDVTSSPTYPQSNGKAEPAIKLMKIIKGTWTSHQLDKRKLALSLLQYRNTPSRRDGASWHRSCFGSQFRTLYQHIILRLISQG